MTKLINNWLIGSDIELFVQDRKTREIISAEGFIRGTKDFPYKFDKSNRFFATSLDNVLAEFNIPPTNKMELFLEYIRKSRGYIDKILPKRYCTVAQPAALLDEKWLQTKAAKEFGCEADFNVWLGEKNEKPEASGNLRSAGFHLHVSYDNHSEKVSEMIVKALDLHVAVPSVLQEPDNKRKQLYGKAGAFRFKEEYGVEYRVPSNYLLQEERLIAWVFGATIKALDFVNDGRIDEIDSSAELIQAAINTNDKVLAQNLINQFELELV